MTFLDKLDMLMAHQNINKHKLSIMSDVPYTTIDGFYKKGYENAKISTIRKIARALDVSLDFLIESESDAIPHSAAKKAPSDGLSEEALKVGRDYAKLDPAGKSLVRVVIAEEEKRVKAARAAQRQRAKITTYDGEEVEPRTIPHFFTPAAAGYAEPVFEDDFEYIEVGGDVPAYADFAVDVGGDSMEPYIMDGSTVYVNRDPLDDGDVGIFFVDGDMICKQYQRDPDGTVHLLSLNRARADADRHITPDSGISMTCFGRVILPSQPNKVK